MLPDPELSAAQCLDSLEANLNTLLFCTGSALHEPVNFDATHITLTRNRVHRSLPSALDSFHRALGSLELSLIRSKCVLQRDYAASFLSRDVEDSSNQTIPSPDHQADSLGNDQLHNETKASSHTARPLQKDSTQPNSKLPNGELVDPTKEAAEPSVTPNVTIPPIDTVAEVYKKEAQDETIRRTEGPTEHTSPEARVSRNVGPVDREENPNDLRSSMAHEGSPRDGSKSQSEDAKPPQPPLHDSSNIVSGDAEAVSALLPGLELYANDDGGLVADENAPSNVENGHEDDKQTYQGDSDPHLHAGSGLPEDLLSGQDDGTSFNEQFDFGPFDFGTIGDAEGFDAGADGQAFDHNYFDESLFNLDG